MIESNPIQLTAEGEPETTTGPGEHHWMNPEQAHRVFASPVDYLASLGLEAEIVGPQIDSLAPAA